LLPDDKRQPGLADICHLVHRRSHQGSLFIVVSADLMSPSKAKSTETRATPCEDITGPFPAVGNIPDSERCAADDVHACTKDHWRPAPPLQKRVRAPSVCQCRHYGHCVRRGRIYVDLPDFVYWIFAPLEILSKDRRSGRSAVVEGNV
jgi:hypothetical protein